MDKIKASWNGARVTFNFMDCPSCNGEIKAKYCKEIEESLAVPRKLKADLIKKALERALIEGIDKDEKFNDPAYAFFNDL